MKIHWPSGRASMIAIAFGALLLSSCGVGSAGNVTPAARTATATVAAQSGGASNHVITIPNNDIFAPYMTVRNAGDTVIWLNQDAILHTILTAPTTQGGAVDPEQFQIVLGPGKPPVVHSVKQGSIATTVTRTRPSRIKAQPQLDPECGRILCR
jgi:plastocyanin